MPKRFPKDDPHLFFYLHAGDLYCHIQDLKLVLKKTEEIEFEDHPDELEYEGLISDIFPDIVRKSFVVLLIIALETEFKSFCGLLKEIESLSLKWNELRGPSLDRFICYCERLSNVKVCNDNTNRQLIKGLIEARNCIIHNNSSIEFFDKAKEVVQFAKAVQGVSIENGYLTFSYEACLTCADIMHAFMQDAYNAALEKYPKK
jgi:hypothetical protein